MNKLCYYAHPMLSYDSTVEAADMELLKKLGFEVINPNSQIYQTQSELYVAEHGKGMEMDYFTNIVMKCDLVAFRGLVDGNIPSGVAKEIEAAWEAGIPVIELPVNLVKRMLNYPETKNYLYEIGFYKVKSRMKR
jgi:hypothetical protein